MAEGKIVGERKIMLEMDLKNIIYETREVAQAMLDFAKDLEQIQEKYADLSEAIKANEESENSDISLCDSCANKGRCWLMQRYGEARSKCNRYMK